MPPSIGSYHILHTARSTHSLAHDRLLHTKGPDALLQALRDRHHRHDGDGARVHSTTSFPKISGGSTDVRWSRLH